MQWLIAFHIIFVVTWFAGLFYLPRLFVYSALNDKEGFYPTLMVMQRKLLVMMHIGGGLALFFGLVLVVIQPGYLALGWMHAKLALVVGLVAYHLWCARIVRVFRRGENRRSHVWYRWFNEVPALALVGIVILAVVRPF